MLVFTGKLHCLQTMSRPNIDIFGQYLIISDHFSLTAASSRQRSWRREFLYIPRLDLPKTTARVGSSSSTTEKKAVRRDGGRLLIVYSTIVLCD